MFGQILATVIGGAILDKIRRNKMPDPKPVIGSGTAPQLDSGIPLELTEIAGTTAPTPEQALEMGRSGDFNNLSPEEQERLLMQLFQQENDGIMGMYHGGQIHNYSSGGALGGLFGLGLLDNIDTLIDLPEILDDVKDRFPKATDFFTNLDPEIKEILGDTAAEGLLALLKKYDEPRGSIVSTRTLPAGNANRRRMMIKQIGMQDGGATGKTSSDADMNQFIERLNKFVEMSARANLQQGRAISDKDREFYSQLFGATLSDEDIVNLLAQANTQTGRRISDKDREYQRSVLGLQDGDDVLDRKMFKPMLGGGELDGPGGPKDDMIPIMASDGEFMLSKATVDMLGGGNHSKGIAALEKINNKGNRMYG